MNKTEMAEKGYTIIDNFLPQEVAETLHQAYVQTTWDFVDQVRDHYKHVFATNNPRLPGKDELYKAQFSRSHELEQSQILTSIFDEYFKPAVIEAANKTLTEFDKRCYKLEHGDFYRAHIDDYAAEIGIIYYINKKWCWDWGGILNIASNDDANAMEPVFPEFNRLMLIGHGKFRFPHFISTVSQYAQNPRYTLIAFCK